MKSILPVFLLLFFSFHYSMAQVESSAPRPEDFRNEIYFRANSRIPGPQCPAGTRTKSLSDLEILGKSISSIQPRIEVQGCVMARSTREAFSNCGNGYNIINLSNPQYDEDLTDQLYVPTSRVATPFYCIQHEYSMAALKRQRCEELRADPIYNTEFKFRMTFATGDGSCQVQRISDGSSAKWELHSDRLEELFHANRFGAPQILTELPDVTLPPLNIDTSSLAGLSNVNLGEDVDTKINTCITRWRDRANICKSGADEVLQTCGENRAAPAGTVSQGDGTQQTLFETGARLSATQSNLDRQITSCTEGARFCTTSCNPDQANQMVADCLRDARQTEAELNTTYPELSRTLQSAKTEVRDLFSEGNQICTAQVPSRRLNLNNVLNQVVSAIRVAAVGSCQTSSSNSQNCNQIPTIPDCQSNPGLNGCNVFSEMSSCAVGSVYHNAPACACVRNPGSCAPQVGNTAGTTSSFGGNLTGASLPQSSGGAVSFAGGGSGSGSGSFGDLSNGGGGGSAAPANFAGNLKAGEISTGGAASGASVGGGGNGAASPAGAPQAAAPVAEKGIGALFKDLKNVVTSAFGAGSNKASPKAAGNVAVNADRFKPQMQGQLRGGPQRRDIASANEKTLFELVNECANGLRCKMPGDSYLVNP